MGKWLSTEVGFANSFPHEEFLLTTLSFIGLRRHGNVSILLWFSYNVAVKILSRQTVAQNKEHL